MLIEHFKTINDSETQERTYKLRTLASTCFWALLLCSKRDEEQIKEQAERQKELILINCGGEG